jgi:hypothetical protein
MVTGGEEENNPIMAKVKGTPVQNTTAPICNNTLELHYYSNPDPTSNLTCHPDTNSIQKHHNPRALRQSELIFAKIFLQKSEV